MPETCCVDGCGPPKEDVTFFKFPNSRALRRKWLDAIPSTSVKVTMDTAVCSRHFLAEQYELVRSKRRLKAKVVPSVFDTITKPTDIISERTTSLQTDGKDDRVNSNITTDNSTDNNMDTGQRTPSPDHRLEGDTKDNESSRKNGLKEDIVKRRQPDDISITDSEIINKDIEDIITNYQIKQIRPVHQQTETETETGGNSETDADDHPPDTTIEIEVPGTCAEIEIGRNEDSSEVIDVDNEAEPVFIEVSVGRGGRVHEASNQDCMMLLESVQCEVDPSCLMFPDPEPPPDHDPGDDSDVVDLGEKKEDPISLLTSSDEDEVIIEEPQYDLVEVSDETDEDDVPLVKLVDRPKPTKAKKPKSKKAYKKPSADDTLTKILWGQLYEYFCMECHFKSTSRAEYKAHLQEHSTVIQVCELCGYTTSSKHQFERHKRKHRADKRYKCHLCVYKARHNMSLVYHMKSHQGAQLPTNKGDFKCEKCLFETSERADMLKHVRTCCRMYKKFACNKCTYETDRRTDMKRHKDRRHQGGDEDDDEDYVPPQWVKPQ